MSAAEPGRVLVAGIGNVFLGDDGFGVEVANRLQARKIPPLVDVVDYGIRGVHLAYELLDGRHDTLVLVDAMPLDESPGTVVVLQVDPDTAGEADDPPGLRAPAIDGHGMSPDAVLSLLRTLGGSVRQVFVVGCRPQSVDPRMGLSEPVRSAVGPAADAVLELVGTVTGSAGPSGALVAGAGEQHSSGVKVR